MRNDRFGGDRAPVILVLIGSLLSSFVVGLPILAAGLVLALRRRA